jgi:maltose alpha-D-glucosyltransferase / alpha-amylase
MATSRPKRVSRPQSNDPLWYKSAIIYEIPIRAYADDNGDGIGDISGLITKLDYLQDLGVTAIWLLPFYPSPLRDGGYDISDYTSVHPMYGSLADFKRLLKEAHERGIRVITELVINHTSKDHPWFERARKSRPNSSWRKFYVWSDTNDRYGDARIIFRDFESSNWTWDPEAGAFYWHRFYSHQPDLNFDNPEVHKAVLKALDFWLELGVDGLRLDAVPYLYERDHTNCENLPETHAFLKKLRKHVDDHYEDRMLLAEANQWPEDAAAYFGSGDECHMNFHFPLMPRMFMAVQLEDHFPIVDILRQTPDIPDNCQWATFLRNHDELTLEMVTDEDRDYMYKAYAQDPVARLNLGIRRRLAPLLHMRQKVELMNGLLFSLPGTPVLYYGDEIGMGDNIYLGDRDGVRTPMQWSADRNAGFSRANPQQLYLPVIADPEYRYEAVNVQAQQNNPSSLLWWMKRTIALRKQHPALGSGRLELLAPDNNKILAFMRLLENEKVLVVANLSRFHQWVELDLAPYAGFTPVEMAGVVRFPSISAEPYRLSLAPFGFMWFLLEPSETPPHHEESIPHLRVKDSWREIFSSPNRRKLERTLTDWVRVRRWFRGKARRHQASSIRDVLFVKEFATHALVLLTLEFSEGDPQTYLLPVALLSRDDVADVEHRCPHALIAHVDGIGDGACALVDSVVSGKAGESLLALIRQRATARGTASTKGTAHSILKKLAASDIPPPKATEFEQTNSTLLFGDQFLLKVYRQLESGVNSELEIGEFLTRYARGAPVPKVLGALRYQEAGDDSVIALVQEFVPNQGTAWDMTIDRVHGYFDRVLSRCSPPEPGPSTPPPPNPELDARDVIGSYLVDAFQLGERTAQVHLALAGRREPASFAPEPFTTMHQQSIYQWARSRMTKTFSALRKQLSHLPSEVRPLVSGLLEQEKELDKVLRRIKATKIIASRIRCHGDLHLGQVLHTGDDFVIIDFEGEPARPLNERSYKRCPLRDVMGMVRSFNYATEAVLRRGQYRESDMQLLRPWARAWEGHVRQEYLRGYFETAEGASFIPNRKEHVDLLLSFYGMEKAIYEIGYEMNNRPDWLPIPIAGLQALVAGEHEDG